MMCNKHTNGSYAEVTGRSNRQSQVDPNSQVHQSDGHGHVSSDGCADHVQTERGLANVTPLGLRDGIHQIVSRFLERFRYMCPLLFSCFFPS
jgi:hypothetical protein